MDFLSSMPWWWYVCVIAFLALGVGVPVLVVVIVLRATRRPPPPPYWPGPPAAGPGQPVAPPPLPRRPHLAGVPCPQCGHAYYLPIDRPAYLQLFGAMLVRPGACAGCGHRFDQKKPSADLDRRQRSIGIAMNLAGLVGICLIVAGMLLLIANL